MSALDRPRRRKRERRGGRGALENRARLETILEPRELGDVKKPLLRSETGENDPRGSRLRPFVGPARAYGTPDFDPSEPIPFVLTPAGRRALEDDDELAQEEEEELEELGLEELGEDELDDDDDDELEEDRPW